MNFARFEIDYLKAQKPHSFCYTCHSLNIAPVTREGGGLRRLYDYVDNQSKDEVDVHLHASGTVTSVFDMSLIHFFSGYHCATRG